MLRRRDERPFTFESRALADTRGAGDVVAREKISPTATRWRIAVFSLAGVTFGMITIVL